MSGLPDSCHLSLPAEPPQSLLGRVELLESSLAQIVQIQVRTRNHVGLVSWQFPACFQDFAVQEGKLRDSAKQAQIDVLSTDPTVPEKGSGCCCIM